MRVCEWFQNGCVSEFVDVRFYNYNTYSGRFIIFHYTAVTKECDCRFYLFQKRCKPVCDAVRS